MLATRQYPSHNHSTTGTKNESALVNKALNHMTMAKGPFASFIKIASAAGCIGVEVRNDLGREMFDGENPMDAAGKLCDSGLRLLAIAEVSAFNDLSDRAYSSVQELATLAGVCGAEAISLIPRNDGLGVDLATRKECLQETLIKFAPVLEQHQVRGLIEPLGFEKASIRYKSEVVDVLESLRLTERYQIVHDTFHHRLAGGEEFFPEHTGIVHVSGVTEPAIETRAMRDEHRGLVEEGDRLENLEQLTALLDAGYTGPVSIEAFASQVHELKDPKASLSACFTYIESNLATA